MAEGAPFETDLHRSLLERLAAAPDASGDATAVFGAAGAFIGLLGFDDGDRDSASADCCRELLRRGLPLFIRPLGPGGLLVALARSCQAKDAAAAVGCAVVLPAPRHVGASEPPSIDAQLFHEASGRFIVCLPADRQTDARLCASEHGVPFWPLGRSGGRELVVRASTDVAATGGAGFQEVVRLPVAALFSAAPASV